MSALHGQPRTSRLHRIVGVEGGHELAAEHKSCIPGLHPSITLADVDQQFERLFLPCPMDKDGGSPLAGVVQAAGLDGLNLEVSNTYAHATASTGGKAEDRATTPSNATVQR